MRNPNIELDYLGHWCLYIKCEKETRTKCSEETHVCSASDGASLGPKQYIFEVQLNVCVNTWHDDFEDAKQQDEIQRLKTKMSCADYGGPEKGTRVNEKKNIASVSMSTLRTLLRLLQLYLGHKWHSYAIGGGAIISSSIQVHHIPLEGSIAFK